MRDGSLTSEVALLFSAEEIYGIDKNPDVLTEAQKKRIKYFICDLEFDKLPFSENYFDVITAFDVIEHLWNPGNMLDETYRVLKNKGLFILTTPNIASWVNRFLFFFGYLPYEYECPSKYGEDLEKRLSKNTLLVLDIQGFILSKR
jgi:ubiquinone/menaquinone biosynthesis C-methylase UbiE